MNIKREIRTILILLLFCVPVFFTCCLPAAASDYWSGPDTSYNEQGHYAAQSKEHDNKIQVKKWLVLFGTLSGFALLLLILFEVGGGGLLPDAVEDAIAKTCVIIIAITLCLFFYYLTSILLFIIIIPIGPAAVLYFYLKRKFNRVYRRRFAEPSSPDTWICRKCGMENSNLMKECENCSNPKDSRHEADKKQAWKCGNCGYLNSTKDKSCAKCGTRREGE